MQDYEGESGDQLIIDETRLFLGITKIFFLNPSPSGKQAELFYDCSNELYKTLREKMQITTGEKRLRFLSAFHKLGLCNLNFLCVLSCNGFHK